MATPRGQWRTQRRGGAGRGGRVDSFFVGLGGRFGHRRGRNRRAHGFRLARGLSFGSP